MRRQNHGQISFRTGNGSSTIDPSSEYLFGGNAKWGQKSRSTSADRCAPGQLPIIIFLLGRNQVKQMYDFVDFLQNHTRNS